MMTMVTGRVAMMVTMLAKVDHTIIAISLTMIATMVMMSVALMERI